MTIIPVKDFSDIARHIRNFAVKYPPIIERALYQEASAIMGESKSECPVETGKLRASGGVSDPIVEDGKISISIGYGTEYAVFVHEILTNFHAPPTKAKFLEDPVRRNAPNFLENVAARIDASLAEGV